VLAGRPPASTKGHFYWLKVAGGCLARQQKPVLAAKTNRFLPSDVAASCYDWCDGVRPRRGELPTAGSALAHFPFFFRFLDFFPKKTFLQFFSKFLRESL
jgi:hypothetical protein